MSSRVELFTHNEQETFEVGRALGRALRGGERIALGGELGAGKTVLVRGIAAGLDIPQDEVRSPSFTLLATYEGGRIPLHHLDLFRLNPSPADCMSLREILYGDAVAAVEWFENLGEELADCLEIRITFVGTDTRRLVATARGLGYEHLLEVLAARSGRDTTGTQ